MLSRLLERLRLPDLGGDEANERLRVVHVLCGALLVAALYGHLTPPPDAWHRYLATAAVLFSLWAARRGRLSVAGLALPVAVLWVLADSAWTGYGLHDVTFLGLPLVLAIAGLLLGGRGPLLFGPLVLLVAAALYQAEASGRLRTPWSPELTLDSLVVALLLLGIDALVLSLIIYRLDRSLSRSRGHALALQESEARWRALIQDAPLTVLVVDARATLTFVNLDPAPAARLLGRDVFELFEAPHLAAAREAVSRTLASGEVTGFEAEMGTGPGDRWRYAIQVGPVRVEDRIVGATLLCIDTMERHRAREERERLIHELGERNAELQRFTYSVSHDLRSPLVTVKGFLGAILSSARRGDLQRVEEDAARVRAAADRMDLLLGELLELSRIGRLRHAREPVDLAALAAEARDQVAGRLADRGIEVEIGPGLPTVHGERLRLAQLMQNLLDNAAKFMGDQPRPRIEIGVRREHGGAEAVIYVRDNGLGIEPRHGERVFGLFERLDANAGGTGLGLAIARRVVESHGGRIWVESEGPGHGSTFCFTLAEAPGPEPAGVPPGPG
ncbi:MAG: ATP-binding protein [Vicinamibacteria bacterium]